MADGDLPNVDGDGHQGVLRISAAHVRSRTGLSQAAIAALGLPVAYWHDWEQGWTRIGQAGAVLLDRDPVGMLDAVRQALAAGSFLEVNP